MNKPLSEIPEGISISLQAGQPPAGITYPKKFNYFRKM
jgi:hypothetical protein